MLCGGAVVYYLKKLHGNEDCSLSLTGFQVSETEGDNLLRTGRYVHDDLDLKVKMDVRKFDFSAHASDSNLNEFIEEMGPKKVFCVHGDDTKGFADRLNDKGIDAESPTRGQEFKL